MVPFVSFLIAVGTTQKDLPDDFVKTVAFLQAHGLGDPRTGAYRATQAIAPDPWDWARPRELHGWAFPDGRFVTRDGLTYLGITRTMPADLDSDVQKEIAGLSAHNSAPPSSDEIQARLFASVLLTAERPDLAHKLLDVAPPYEPRASNLATIRLFLTRRYGQAVATHLKGDDRDAHRVERGLLNAAVAYDERDKGEEPWWLIAAVRNLSKDTNRRLSPPRPKVQSEAQRLIADLQNVKVQQNGLPGRAQFVDSVTVRRLIALGDQAVDPLLDCVEHDARLTRSASYGQGMIPSVETVETAARTALFALLDVPVFDPSIHGGEVPVARLKAYWAAHRRQTRPQRQFAVLADDAARPSAWSVAAERLFGKPKLPHFFDNPAPIGQGLTLPPKEVRSRSLADLLVRRASAFDQARPGESRGYGLHQAARLAAMLTLIDHDRGLALMRDLTHEAGDLFLAHTSEFDVSEVIGSGFAFRADHGDRQAWTEYRDWLSQRRAQPVRAFWVFHEFDPLLNRPNEPALRGASAEFFGPGSPWRPLAMAKAGRRPEEMFASPLLRLPEVRAGIVELLEDRTEGATLTVQKEAVALKRDGNEETMFLHSDHKDIPPVGTTMRLRYADLFAYRLQGFRDMPDFHYWWPQAQRDAALASMIRVVKKGGDLYRFRRWYP